ncbi:MAG: HD domain-containing protein [Bacteroidales bacterium]
MTELSRELLEKYYAPDSNTFRYLHTHSLSVARLALSIVEHNRYSTDREWIVNAAMLHDIGIFKTHAPGIGCFGNYPYLAHGYLGREILEQEGLHDLAKVCERHVGVGISAKEIRSKKLPLPERNMLPLTLEEQIICYADKFFSKDPEKPDAPKRLEDIRASLLRHGKDKLIRFNQFAEQFGSDYIYR